MCFGVCCENILRYKFVSTCSKNVKILARYLFNKEFYVVHFSFMLYFVCCIFETNDKHNHIFTYSHMSIRFWLSGNQPKLFYLEAEKSDLSIWFHLGYLSTAIYSRQVKRNLLFALLLGLCHRIAKVILSKKKVRQPNLRA